MVNLLALKEMYNLSGNRVEYHLGGSAESRLLADRTFAQLQLQDQEWVCGTFDKAGSKPSR